MANKIRLEKEKTEKERRPRVEERHEGCTEGVEREKNKLRKGKEGGGKGKQGAERNWGKDGEGRARAKREERGGDREKEIREISEREKRKKRAARGPRESDMTEK